MPATLLSLKVTEEYRAKLTALTRGVQREVRISWKDLDWNNLSASYAPIRERIATSIEYAQREAVHLTAGYMGAFLTSELGTPIDPPTLVADKYVGRSFEDAPLRDALNGPLYAVLGAIRDGAENPLGQGLRALLANADLDVMAAGRQSLIDAVAADARCDGFKRAVKGTCPACAAKAGADGRTRFPVHPHCQCVGEPVVDGPSKNRHQRRDAQQRFDDMSFDEQNDLYGFDIAQLIRDARVEAADLARVDGSIMSTKALKDLAIKPRSPLSLEQRMKKLTDGISPDKPKQPIKSFDDLFDQAERTKQEYRELLDLKREFQTRMGADATVGDDLAAFEKAAARLSAVDRPQVVIAPLKRRATAEAKLKRKGYGPEGLSDINRGSIIVRNPDDIPAAFAQLRRICVEKGWKMSEVEDRFSGQSLLGYRDVAVNLTSPTGHVTEFQFHVNNLWAAKFRGGGHQLYEQLRKYTEIKAERPLTGLEKAEQRRLSAQTVELYNGALAPRVPSVVKVTERPSGASVTARLDEMSVGETELHILGPTNRSMRTILKNDTETRFIHAVRDADGNILWNRNTYLFDQRWDTPVWTRERKKLHEKIVKKFLDGEIREEGIGVPRAVERPRLVSTAGGGASGKSSMIRAGQVDFGEDGAVTVANDLIKEQLPEYVKMVAAKDPWAANAVNEESAYISKLIAEAAVKNHYNVLLDIVGDGPPGVFAQSIRGFDAAGYSMEVDYASAPLALAQRRALVREAKTGRRADPDAIAKAHLSASQRFNEINAIERATVRVYDTTTEGPVPLLVYEKLPGHRGRVLDRPGWQRWLAKQKPEVQQTRAAQIKPSRNIRSRLVKPDDTKRAVEAAIKAVDDVHAYPDGTVPTEIVRSKLKFEEGNFTRRTIEIGDDAEDPFATTLHELGHKADLALSASDDLGFATNGPLDVRHSADVIKVLKALRNSEAVARLGEGWTSRKFVYYTQPHELFARAYAQWITRRHGGEIKGIRGDIRDGIQWSDDDFAPIAAAMDDLFRGRGLLRGTAPSRRVALEGDDALKYVTEKAPGTQYTGPVEGYQYARGQELNRLLRGDEVIGGVLRVDGPGAAATERVRLEELRDKLDAMMEDAGPLGESVVVWRGLPGLPEKYGLTSGRTLTERGFSSSSLDRETADYFANSFGGDGFVMKLTVHPDVRATYIGKTGMKELLVERNARYVVKEVSRHEVEINVLPPLRRTVAVRASELKRPPQLELDSRAKDLLGDDADAMALVHRVPDSVTPVKVKAEIIEDGEVDGRYQYNLEGSKILISPVSDEPGMALAHEFGHHFDRMTSSKDIPGLPYGFQSLSDSALNGWREAVHGTKLVRQLREGNVRVRMAGSDEPIELPTGMMPPYRDMINYLLDPRELWARSYAQWIGLRSGRFKPLTPEARVLDQWSDEDFKPIAKALDDYFEKLGLKNEIAAPEAAQRSSQYNISPAFNLQTRKITNGRSDAMKAIRAVTSTHEYPPGTPETVITQGPLKLEEGKFNPKTNQITVATDAVDVTETVLHELGHKIDLALRDPGEKTYATQKGFPARDVRSVLSAIRKSDGWARLDAFWKVHETRAYYQSSHEAFARAYAQWIARREGLPEPPPAEIDHGVQWDDADFKPIADAFDALFRGRKLLT